jgi:hypothetical protein
LEVVVIVVKTIGGAPQVGGAAPVGTAFVVAVTERALEAVGFGFEVLNLGDVHVGVYPGYAGPNGAAHWGTMGAFKGRKFRSWHFIPP